MNLLGLIFHNISEVKHVPQDSTGKRIMVGDRVRFRGKEYTIKNFIAAGAGPRSPYQIEFVEDEVHTDETPTEFSVDLVAN